MTEFKSIQELLNALYSCIAIDDKGNAYLRTNSSGVTPDPDPDPTPTFTQIGTQHEIASTLYNQYLRRANLAGIHCQRDENGDGSFSTELNSSAVTTINFSEADIDNLAFADVEVKNENGIIYLQNADTLKWLKQNTFLIQCGHLIAIKKLDTGDYISPTYTPPHIIIGDSKDSGYGDLLGKLSSLIPGIPDGSVNTYRNLFEGMFANSPRLANVNVHYPHIIGQNIYKRMFAGCPILNTANLYISDKPQMNAECIGFAESIFDGCINLSKLNATIGCNELPAARMFANAFNNTQVNSLTINANSISDVYKVEDPDYPLHNWLGGASNRQGTIIKPYALTLTENSESGIPTNWTVRNTGEPPTPPEPEKPDLDKFDPNVPFCIENVGDVPVEIGMCNVYNFNDIPQTPEVPTRGNCKISYDLVKWENYNFVLKPDTDINKTEDLEKITLRNNGDRVYIKADKLETALNTDIFLSTIIKVINTSENPRIKVGGNIASWNKGSNDSYIKDYLEMNSKDSYCYQYMFKDCDCLVRSPEVRATRLAESCYYAMFSGCSNLTQSPALPAMNLATSCYGRMFSGCTNLKDAPTLPATTLAHGCYSYMFSGCTSLTQAPELPATTLTGSCYIGMFNGCRSLTQAPNLPSTKLDGSCYAYMFKNCSSLAQAPELPATELAPAEALIGCYSEMFSGCSKLLQAPRLPATTLTSFCYDQMFSGCTSLTQAPELPATTLTENCYRQMFVNCLELNYIRCSATDISASQCTYEWVSGIGSVGNFYAPASTNWTTGGNGIPLGWTRHDIT